MTTRKTFISIYHKDGSLTYWSVYQQQWIKHALHIPDQELAAMGEGERKKALKHFARR